MKSGRPNQSPSSRATSCGLDCKPKENFPSVRMVSAGSGRLVDAERPLRPAPKATSISLV